VTKFELANFSTIRKEQHGTRETVIIIAAAGAAGFLVLAGVLDLLKLVGHLFQKLC
jgi:hypothetical protein